MRLRLIKRRMEQIHTDDTERFLLLCISLIQHANVNDDLAWLATRLSLKSDTEPSVRLVMLLKAAGRYRVGKNKKSALAADFFVQPFHQQIVFVIEHRV